MWGPQLSPNMEYLKLWVCIRTVTLRCLKIAELICIQFKFSFGNLIFIRVGPTGY
jgi:hypothetical protein